MEHKRTDGTEGSMFDGCGIMTGGLVGLVVFGSCWLYSITTFGWFLGLAFGWIPSLFIALLAGTIAGLLWPLLAIGGTLAVVAVYVLFASPQAGPDTASASKAAEELSKHIAEAAELYTIPEPLIHAVIDTIHENPNLLSRKAVGVMAIPPAAIESLGIHDPHDPVQNIYGGTRLLRILANSHDGDLVKTLASYHECSSEECSVVDLNIAPDASPFIRRVLSHYDRHRNNM